MSETGLLTMHEVLGLTTFSRPAFYRLITAGQFPQPLKLGQFKEVTLVSAIYLEDAASQYKCT